MWAVGLIIDVAIGVLLIVLGGLIWGKKKVGLIHEYHWKNVPAVHIPEYAKLIGISLILLGVSLILTGIINTVFNTEWGLVGLAIGFVAFFVIANHAQKKYNGSWF